MVITITELFLVVWAVVATIAYVITKNHHDGFKEMTARIFLEVSQGKATIIETEHGVAINRIGDSK